MRARPGIALASLALVLWATIPGGGCTTFDGLVAAGADGKISPRPDASADAGAGAGADAAEAGEDAAVEPGLDAAPVIPPDAAAPPPGYLPLADAVSVCTLAYSCKNLWSSIWTSLAVPIDPTNFSLCVDWLAGPLPPLHPGIALQRIDLACVAKATSCQAAGACLAFENMEPSDLRCTGDAGVGTGESCMNNTTILLCATRQIWHCDNGYYAPDQLCLLASDGWHYCAQSAGCPTYACTGSLFFGCWGASGDLEGATNCLHNGETCGGVPDAGGFLSCLTDGQERRCTGLNASCAGTKAEVCDTLYVSQYDCAELGGTCSAAAGLPQCRRPSDSCTISDTAINACQADGTTVSLCVGGRRVDFDCASLTPGKVCKPQAGAVSGHCG
jgi:hypothetical protein